MEKEEYGRLAARESYYFWNIGRREILREVLLRHLAPAMEREVLDIGCGAGGNILVLREFGRVSGLDIADEALNFSKDKGFYKLIKADVQKIPLADASFDLVSSFDMFEHVEDDKRAMREALRVLKPGGILINTVPAHPWLWSSHDKALHHVRRYRKKDFIQKLKGAGFEVLESSHFVSVAIPINFLRKLRDYFFWKKGEAETYDKDFSAPLNNFLLFILRCEKRIMRFISIPLGSSLVVVARKPWVEPF